MFFPLGGVQCMPSLRVQLKQSKCDAHEKVVAVDGLSNLCHPHVDD